MQLHQLQPKTKNRSEKRVGRGGTRGKTSGRGMKGQKARAGHSIRPAVRDIIKKLPKRRGYGKNRARTVNDSRVRFSVINLFRLEGHFSDGETVTPLALQKKSLIRIGNGKKSRTVKILGTGPFKKKLSFANCEVSKNARVLIEKAGGTIVE